MASWDRLNAIFFFRNDMPNRAPPNAMSTGQLKVPFQHPSNPNLPSKEPPWPTALRRDVVLQRSARARQVLVWLFGVLAGPRGRKAGAQDGGRCSSNIETWQANPVPQCPNKGINKQQVHNAGSPARCKCPCQAERPVRSSSRPHTPRGAPRGGRRTGGPTDCRYGGPPSLVSSRPQGFYKSAPRGHTSPSCPSTYTCKYSLHLPPLWHSVSGLRHRLLLPVLCCVPALIPR